MVEVLFNPHGYPPEVSLHERYGYPLTKDFEGILGRAALDLLGITTGYETRFIKGPEGRQLAIQQSGHSGKGNDVKNILVMHGTPGTRTGFFLNEELLDNYRVNIVSYDRPGYGYSDPPFSLLDRHPVDTVRDVDAIMEELGLETLDAVIGVSGGSIHALACASLRAYVKKAAILVPPAPVEHMGDDYYIGMSESNREVFEMVRTHPERLIESFQTSAEAIRRDPKILLTRLKAEFAIDDIAMFSYSGTKQAEAEFLATIPQALAFGGEGRAADIIGQSRWGFDPRDHTANPGLKTLVWYAGEDVFVPSAQGAWLANNIPRVESVYREAASHMRAKDADVTLAVLYWCLYGWYGNDDLGPSMV